MRVNKHQSLYILLKPDASEVEEERGSCNARSSEGTVGGKEGRDARGGCSIGREEGALQEEEGVSGAHVRQTKRRVIMNKNNDTGAVFKISETVKKIGRHVTDIR